ncbi:MAG: ribulose-phosphate 3-epimerase [Ruminococcus sp.]|nr:ribulose-phosphate 3-epimerase [Ruminococcus sp.]
MKNYVSASVLSADMLSLGDEIKKLEKNGIEMLHFDVMDGIFVNNITFGLPVLERMKNKTDIVLDVHLMIADPLKYVKRFAESGADIISFHIESDSDTMATINVIRESGAKAALALKPATPAEEAYKYMPYLDMVLVMTVEPGFSGQKFMDMSDKISKIRKYADENGYDVDIEVDGGINDVTSETVKKAGANVLVSGSYLFKAENMKETADRLRSEI